MSASIYIIVHGIGRNWLHLCDRGVRIANRYSAGGMVFYKYHFYPLSKWVVFQGRLKTVLITHRSTTGNKAWFLWQMMKTIRILQLRAPRLSTFNLLSMSYNGC